MRVRVKALLFSVNFDLTIPANCFRGILSSIDPALFGSDQAFLPMSVITTIGFTAFTRIYVHTTPLIHTCMVGTMMEIVPLKVYFLCIILVLKQSTVRIKTLKTSSNSYDEETPDKTNCKTSTC